MNSKFQLSVTFAVWILLASYASAAISVSVSQSGADSGEVMNDRTFIVTASGWSDSCSQATITFADCSVCSLSGEETQKTIGESSSLSWTTVTASQTATDQKVSVIVTGCSDGSGESSSFDVVLPPSLTFTVSTDASSVDKGGTFDINIEIDNDGETTANDLTIDADSSFTEDCSSISSLDGDQNVGDTCTVTAPTSTAGGSKTVTFTVSSTNADDATDSVTITLNSKADDGICDPGEADLSDCDSGGGGNGAGTSGGAAVSPSQNRTRVQELNPGVGLMSNARLQTAIENVLAKGKLSEEAKDNLMRLSQSITSDVSSTHNFNIVSGKSKIQNRIKYSGQKRIKNFIVFESVPKNFAQNASMVTVNAQGGTVQVAEEDPSWVILFPEVDPGQELTITYEVTGQKSTTVLDGMATEVYAESLEDAPTTSPDEGEVPGDDTGKTTTPTGGEAPLGIDMTILIIAVGIVAVVIVIVILFLVRKPGKKSAPAQPIVLRPVN